MAGSKISNRMDLCQIPLRIERKSSNRKWKKKPDSTWDNSGSIQWDWNLLNPLNIPNRGKGSGDEGRRLLSKFYGDRPTFSQCQTK